MDHVFGSKWLINELARLGFSITYDEVVRYKFRVKPLTEYPPDTFTQWAADNVDHNVATLDGQGTFHGIGILAISTAKDHAPLKVQSWIISRQQYTKVNVLVKDKGVPIVKHADAPKKGLSSIMYVRINLPFSCSFLIPYLLTCIYSDLLWHSGWMFSNMKLDQDQTGQVLCNIFILTHMHASDQCQVSNSEVLLLPIIDLSPTDDSCIYSTLAYIQSQAIHLNTPTPCVTFDQPLWLKAVEIIKAKAMNIVCRLGGFHTLMSFLGSIRI